MSNWLSYQLKFRRANADELDVRLAAQCKVSIHQIAKTVPVPCKNSLLCLLGVLSKLTTKKRRQPNNTQ